MQKQPTKQTKQTKNAPIKSKATKATKATSKAIAKTVKAPKAAPVLPNVNALGAAILAQYAIAVGVQAKRKPSDTIATVKIGDAANPNMAVTFGDLCGKTLYVTVKGLAQGGTMQRSQIKGLARYGKHITLSYNGASQTLIDAVCNPTAKSTKLRHAAQSEHGTNADSALDYLDAELFRGSAQIAHPQFKRDGAYPQNTGADFKAQLAAALGCNVIDYPAVTGVKPCGANRLSGKSFNVKWARV